MSKDQALDDNRRQLLIATSVVGGAGVVAAAAPFVASLTPSERAKAAGAPAEADISKLAPGEMMTVEWRGQPVWILRRTEAMLATLEEVEPQLADPTSETLHADAITAATSADDGTETRRLHARLQTLLADLDPEYA